jgi:hypothetical protein
MHFDYIRTFRSGESVPPEVFRFDRKGFFGVTLIENQQKNGHNLSLRQLNSCHLFPVHRAILSARSSVFAAVFKNIECDDSCNNNEQVNADERLSIIDIGEDLDPDVFEDFLVFIYTGRLRTTENMAELWAAANKYDVKTLERIGESVKGRPKMEEMCLTLMSSL